MEASSRELLQGTLEMLAHKILALESKHGYGLALGSERTSNGEFRIYPDSMLPALSHMERSGRILEEGRSTEKHPPGVEHSPWNAAIEAAKSWLSSGFLNPEEEKRCAA